MAEKRRQRSLGKHGKPPKKKKWGLPITIGAVAILLLGSIFLLGQKDAETSVYRTLCNDGYSGTQEQLLAILIGEEAGEQAQSSYELAVKDGYRKSQSVWMETLTGGMAGDAGKTPYGLACENGYKNTLVMWLTQIAEDPELLGRSDGAEKTEYELACEHGYNGSFVEWLVSLTNDRVF